MLFSDGLNVGRWNMLDAVCLPKCCFNMWNILRDPYRQPNSPVTMVFLDAKEPPRIGPSSVADSPFMRPEPARRRLQPSPASHPWKAASAWSQLELHQSSSSSGRLTTGSQMPRVSQPLRVEPPAAYNAPSRVQFLHRGSGKRGAEQESANLSH